MAIGYWFTTTCWKAETAWRSRCRRMRATRHLEKQASGSYHYPAVIEGRDGRIHFVYSYFVEGGKSMKHVAINEAWIERGDSR